MCSGRTVLDDSDESLRTVLLSSSWTKFWAKAIWVREAYVFDKTVSNTSAVDVFEEGYCRRLMKTMYMEPNGAKVINSVARDNRRNVTESKVLMETKFVIVDWKMGSEVTRNTEAEENETNKKRKGNKTRGVRFGFRGSGTSTLRGGLVLFGVTSAYDKETI